MADVIEDEYAFVIDNCQYSSSQERILLISAFAREVDTISGEFARNSASPAENVGEFVVGDDLGKKIRVLDDKEEGSPMVHCNEVVFEGDMRVKMVRPLRCVSLDGGEFSGGRLGFEDCGGDGVEEDMSKKESEDEGNVGRRNEENAETVVIDVGDEEVDVNLDTELIDGEEEGMANVDTEVVGDDVEEENRVKDFETEVFEFDTSVIECEEEGGIDERTSKGEGIDNVETAEGGSCVKVVGETSNVDVEKVVVEEREGNRDEDGKVGIDKDVSREEGSGMREEGTKGRKRKLPRSMFEQWGEGLGNGEGCLKDARMKVIGVDEKEGDCAMVDGQTSDVNMEEIVVEEKEENRDENGKRETDKEDVLREEGSRTSEENLKKKKRKLHHSMFEQRGEGVENGEGCSKNARMNVVGADVEQGNYAKVDEQMSDATEKEENRVEDGKCENDKRDESGQDGSRLSKEDMTGRTRNSPGSKDARQEGNKDGKSEESLALIKSILDSLKFLVGEKSNDEEVDLYETAKRRGMKFPSPRFRP